MDITEQISEKIWKFKTNANCYFLDFEEKIMIDTGRAEHRDDLKQALSKIIQPEKIQKVFFTHLHYDHIANWDLFANAQFFASKESIEDFNKDPNATTLNPEIAESFKAELQPITDCRGLKVINTPGHANGAICLWYEKENVLFSGDTLFFKKLLGRTDLPLSDPEKMKESVIKLSKYDVKILCPGHEY